jgi:hypothetical protein
MKKPVIYNQIRNMQALHNANSQIMQFAFSLLEVKN